MADDLKANIDAFEAQREDLEKRHKGKHAVFHGGDFVDAFDAFHMRRRMPWVASGPMFS